MDLLSSLKMSILASAPSLLVMIIGGFFLIKQQSNYAKVYISCLALMGLTTLLVIPLIDWLWINHRWLVDTSEYGVALGVVIMDCVYAIALAGCIYAFVKQCKKT